MIYKTFTIWVSFDNGQSSKDFQVVAIDAKSAIQDITEAYGECLVINHDMGV